MERYTRSIPDQGLRGETLNFIFQFQNHMNRRPRFCHCTERQPLGILRGMSVFMILFLKLWRMPLTARCPSE